MPRFCRIENAAVEVNAARNLIEDLENRSAGLRGYL
jgi:hypothetical protein